MTYTSPLRRRQAEETRAKVVEAARRLFAERGFPATTIADVAREAGVSQQTIYGGFGGKQGLVVALIDLIDRDSDVPASLGRLMASGDPDEILGLAARIPRSVVERSGDLIVALAGAAPTDKAAAAAIAEGRKRHDAALAHVVSRLHEMGALREGVDPDEAAAAFATLTSDSTFARLTERHGWDLDTCERWMRETLRTLYLR
jgi:TetR/AcrR family transcriptional regulator, regulator of cefoperazone and chloramphenicol sensitivity